MPKRIVIDEFSPSKRCCPCCGNSRRDHITVYSTCEHLDNYRCEFCGTVWHYEDEPKKSSDFSVDKEGGT